MYYYLNKSLSLNSTEPQITKCEVILDDRYEVTVKVGSYIKTIDKKSFKNFGYHSEVFGWIVDDLRKGLDLWNKDLDNQIKAYERDIRLCKMSKINTKSRVVKQLLMEEACEK